MIEQLSFFAALLFQATFMGVGGILLLVLGFYMFAKGERDPLSFGLPSIWIAPLLLGGLFVEPGAGPKTADWIASAGVVALVVFAVAVLIAWLRAGESGTAVVVWVLANVPFALASAFVAGVAAGGDWL